MKRFFKKEYMLVAFGVILFVVLFNLGSIFGLFRSLFGALFPVLIGFVVAFVLNVPVRGFENIITRIFKKRRHKPGPRLKRALGVILTALSLFIVMFVAVKLIMPMLADSFRSIYDNVVRYIPELAKFLTEQGVDATALVNWINENKNMEELLKTLSGTLMGMLSSVFSVAVAAVSGLFSVFLSVFVALYALLSKDKLLRQTHRLCTAVFKEKTRRRIYYVSSLLNYKYSKYLSGQFVEACILGVFSFVVLAIFRIPNAFVISFITAVLAFIPYVGAFCAFGIGAFITLVTDPSKLVTYCIILLVVQIVETQFICPNVVGNAVGLSPLWTLIAVFIGGNLLGLIGMVLFIPLFSVLVTLMHEYIDKKLGKEESCLEFDPKAPPLPDDLFDWRPIEHTNKKTHEADTKAEASKAENNDLNNE